MDLAPVSAAPTWPSGLTVVGGDVTSVAAQASARGHQADVLQVVMNGNANEVAATNPLWKQLDTKASHVVVAAPLTAGGVTVGQVADGNTQSWKTLGQRLAAVKDNSSAVRISDPVDSDQAQTRAALEQAASAVKSASPRTLVVVDAPIGKSPSQAGGMLPLDMVDVVGLSVTLDQSWPVLLNGQGGLTDWVDWAAANGKRVAVTFTLDASSQSWNVPSARYWVDLLNNQQRLAYEVTTITKDADPTTLQAYQRAW